MNIKIVSWVIKPIIFVAALIPLSILIWNATHNNLGVDPAKALVDFLGLWALHFLWITLAITPLRHVTKWSWLLRLRRMLGLYALFYASLHVMGYVIFLLELQWSTLGDDILKRPYIMVGFAAFVLLLPLGLTSFNYAMKKLGKNWQRLHQLIYVIAILVALHFLWVARSNIGEQVFYITVLGLLLGVRIRTVINKRHELARHY